MGSADAKVIAKANKIVRDQGCKIVGALTAWATEATLSVVTRGPQWALTEVLGCFMGLFLKDLYLLPAPSRCGLLPVLGPPMGGLGPFKLQITTSNS
jgi:hypothetical protein